MNSFLKKIKQTKGASLLEILVSIALFAVIIIASTQLFKMVIDGQRSAVGAQNVQESIRYAMERISKEIRMAQVGNKECEGLFDPPAAAVNKVFNLTGPSNNVLYFKNKDDVCVAYFLDSNRLKMQVRRASGGNRFNDFVTPLKTEISNLKFYIADDKIGALHSLQPYVTMVMDVKAVGQAMHEQKMKVQFTVSSRYYE